MKKRNVFLFFLLCLAALIALSACASKDVGRQDDVTTLPNTSEAASAPTEDVSAPPENPSDTEEAPTQTDTEALSEMVMGVGVWLPYPDAENRIYDEFEFIEYTLTQKDADRIAAIFDQAEKEEIESSSADIAILYFHLGEDYLAAPMENLNVFSGHLGEKPMLVTLDEESCDAIREIVRRYAGDTAEDVYEAPENPTVTMTVWLDDAEDGAVYTLTPEDASRVITLFEGAETEPLYSPIADFTELCFRFGRNDLDAPIKDLDPFRGSLDGKRVVFTLDEEGCNVIWEIVSRYTGHDIPAEWPDTPSAGEE